MAKFVLSLLLVLAFVGGVSAYTFVQTSDQLSDEIEVEYTGIAEQGALQLDNWQNDRANTALRLSSLSEMESGDAQTAQTRIEEEMTRLPEDVEGLHLINMSAGNGQVLASSRGALQPSGLNTSNPDFETMPSDNAPWVIRNMENLGLDENDLFISPPTRANQKSNIYFVSEVETDDNRDIVLAMQTDIDTLAGNLETGEENQFTTVVNEDGHIIADSRPAEETTLAGGIGDFPNYIEGQNEPPAFVQSESGFAEAVDQGGQLDEDHVAGYARTTLSDRDLVVITKLPSSQAYALRSTVTDSLLLLVGTVFVGFLIIGFTFGRGTVAALARLTNKANQLAEGNLDVALPVRRADEFGTLTAAFASMRDTLKERIDEAERAQKEAEISQAEATELNEYLQDKADEYAEIMQMCAAGDITQRLETEGESKAMDRIATEFNDMIDELEKTTGQLKSFSQEVETAGQDVQDSANLVRDTSEEAIDAANKVVDQVGEETERLDQIAEDIDTVTSDLEAFAESHEDIEIDDALDQIEEISTLLDESLSSTDDIVSAAEDAAEAAEEQAVELGEVSERAGDLVRYAGPLQEVLDRFETESEHEFYFPTGPESTEGDEGEI